MISALERWREQALTIRGLRRVFLLFLLGGVGGGCFVWMGWVGVGGGDWLAGRVWLGRNSLGGWVGLFVRLRWVGGLRGWVGGWFRWLVCLGCADW